MLRVLDELAGGDSDAQLQLLATIHEFALKKYPGMQQQSQFAELGENEPQA